MAVKPPLNIDEILAPLKGDDPAGSAYAFSELKPQFEDLRREVSAEDAPDGQPRNPNWGGLRRQAEEALVDTAKDLRIACYLLEALVKQDGEAGVPQGFAGAHEGLRLLRLLTEQCWDRVNPPLDPEDPEVRAGPYNWIDDPEFGLRFPTTLRLAPLLVGLDKVYSYFDCRPPKDSPTTVTRLDVEQLAKSAPPENLTGMLAEIEGCLQELNGLTETLTSKLGAAAPSMSAVREVLEEARNYLAQILQQRPDVAEKTDKGAEDGAPGPAGAGPGTSRADIYRTVEQAALTLRQLEPHSPIPYLLLRAVELGRKEFPQLLLELVRDAAAATELRREFGIKEETPPAEG